MKRLVMAMLLLGSTAVWAEEEKEAKPKAKGKEPVMMTAGDMKWEEIPDSHGVQISTLWGDFNKGAHGVIVKFPAGTTHPLHTHSSELKTVVISGNFLFGSEGGAEKKFGPGSYLVVPARSKHVSGCDAAGPCMLFQQSMGKFDMKVAGAPEAAPAKK
jgi:quercetin dioxygenase-like cupin family protein